MFFFFFQAEDGIRDWSVTGVQTCALPIYGLFVHPFIFGLVGGFSRLQRPNNSDHSSQKAAPLVKSIPIFFPSSPIAFREPEWKATLSNRKEMLRYRSNLRSLNRPSRRLCNSHSTHFHNIST